MITPPDKLHDNKQRLVIYCALLGLATVLAYWPLTKAGFINFDDNDYVTENYHVTGGLKWAAVKWALTTGYASNWHPVTWISHMLDCSLFGIHPGPMHLVNVLFHALNSCLVFLLLWRMTGARGRSLFVAALFAFHPLHVESVAWISERKDVLSTLFWLLAMWSYITYARESRRYAYWCALFFFILGLMSKPMLVTLPAVFLLLDFYVLRRFPKETLWSLLIEKAPFFCLSVASSIITFLVQRKVAVINLDELPFHLRIVNAIVSYVAYLGKVFAPVNMAIFYPHPIQYPWYEIVLCVAILLLITLGAWLARRKAPYIIFGWLWYLGTLFPVIGIVQVGSQAMADRYTYVPLIGFFFGTVWAAGDLCEWLRLRRVYSCAGAAMVIAFCVAATRIQIGYWRNNLTLFQHAIACTKNNLIAEVNLGAEFTDEGRYEQALQHFDAASQIDPSNAMAHYNMGVTFEKLGRPGEAIRHFSLALRIKPTYVKCLGALADCLMSQGKVPEALECYEGLLRLEPDNIQIQLLVGNTLVGRGDAGEGIKYLQEATRIDPGNFNANLNLASALAIEGRVEEAIDRYQKTIQINPKLTLAHYQFALVLLDAKRDGEAVHQLREALSLSPNAPLVLDKLAWIFSTDNDAQLRNGKEAVVLSTRACEMTKYTNPVTLATLSAACAEEGQFEKAIDYARKSQALCSKANQAKLLDLVDQLMSCYKIGKPYRMTGK